MAKYLDPDFGHPVRSDFGFVPLERIPLRRISDIFGRTCPPPARAPFRTFDQLLTKVPIFGDRSTWADSRMTTFAHFNPRLCGPSWRLFSSFDQFFAQCYGGHYADFWEPFRLSELPFAGFCGSGAAHHDAEVQPFYAAAQLFTLQRTLFS